MHEQVKPHPARQRFFEQERLLYVAREAALAASKAVLRMDEVADKIQDILRTHRSPELHKIRENLGVYLESMERVEREVHRVYETLAEWPYEIYLS